MQSKFNLLLVVLLLASCSQDEFSDKQDTLLPEGVYPLEIASVTLDVEGSEQPWNAPQTRVSENGTGNGSVWNNGDKIKVQIGDGTPGTYTYQDGGLTVAEGDVPAYWESSADDQAITAWYPEEESIDLADQSKGLAYVLQATTQANFNTEVSLSFEHSLSKIRVKLTGDKAEDVTGVQLKSHTTCTHDKGTVSGSGEGWITLKESTYNGETCWEANVVPDYEIKEIQLNGNTLCTLTSNVTPVAGNCHEITIDVESKFTLIESVSEYTVTKNKPVIIRGNVTVRFKDYKCNDCYNGATIKIESGSPTLIFEGTGNSIECSGTPILLAPDAGVTIKGSTNNREDSQLTVQAGGNSAGIGSGVGDRDSQPKTCGTIKIENVTLHANGSYGGSYGAGAGIGTPGNYPGSCGNIEIKNSIVHARGGKGAAAIGIGSFVYRNVTCGMIRIENSQIHATVEYFNPGFTDFDGYGACIGFGLGDNNDSKVSVGEIIITTDEIEATFFSSERFKGINGSGNTVYSGFYKVGKGSSNLGDQQLSGATFNGTSLATQDDKGYPKDAVQ